MLISITIVARFYQVVQGRETAETALTYQAHHDQLTDAANRTLLMQRLTATLHPDDDDNDDDADDDPDVDEPGPGLVLVFIDLDGFKTVNDTWGHPAGDEVLRVVTARLSALVRPTDTVARVGGERVGRALPGRRPRRRPRPRSRIRDSFRRPITLGADQANVGASVGVLTARTCGSLASSP